MAPGIDPVIQSNCHEVTSFTPDSIICYPCSDEQLAQNFSVLAALINKLRFVQVVVQNEFISDFSGNSITLNGMGTQLAQDYYIYVGGSLLTSGYTISGNILTLPMTYTSVELRIISLNTL